MSLAHECDVCGRMYGPTIGAISIDLNVFTKDEGDGTMTGWSGVDLCVECSKDVLRIVRPALNNFPELPT